MNLSLNQTFAHFFLIDFKVYQGFIDVFNDQNPLHTDAEFAVKKGFKEKVMHGNILNGFISYFVGELLDNKNVMILSQTINFKKPVYLNDQLEFEAVVSEQSDAVQVNVISFKFRNEGKQIVATGKIQIKELEQ